MSIKKKYSTICLRENTCYRCEETTCFNRGFISADCTLDKCTDTNRDCIECVHNLNYDREKSSNRYKDAIYYLKAHKNHWRLPDEAINVAIECIGKFIPKEPVFNETGVHCPTCMNIISHESVCGICQQAINWKDK